MTDDKQEDTPLEPATELIIKNTSLRNKLTITNAQYPEAKNMTLRLPVEMHARIAALAKRDHRSIHGQVIAMLEDAAEREERKK